MVLVVGTAISQFGRRRDRSNFRDWVLAQFDAAVADADLTPNDIDALVVASESDLFSLQINPASVIADDIGLRGAATLRVEGGGASGQLAVQAGVAMILAGTARRVAVIGFECGATQLGSDAVVRLYGFSFDGPGDASLGIGPTGLYALSMQCYMAEHGIGPADFAAVSVKNHGNARHNPGAHLPLEISVDDVFNSPLVASPYRRLDCSPISDGAAAIILSARAAAPASRRRAARIAGIGAAGDRVRMGDRNHPGRFEAKGAAARKAYAMAGVDDPAMIGVAEVYDAYSGSELQALEALGLADPGKAAHLLRDQVFVRDGRLPVNLSGGLLGQGAPPGAVGVAQIGTLARILEGRYWPALQPRSIPRYALADTHGGIATNCAVTLLEAAE